MRPVGYGRPGTKVVPDGWEAGQRPVLATTRTATVSLRKPGTTTAWDEASQTNKTTPFPPYAADLPARVVILGQQQARQVTTAADTVVVANYLVTLDAGQTADVDDLVDVTASGDPALTGRSLLVREVGRGSLRFERDLFCTLTDS